MNGFSHEQDEQILATAVRFLIDGGQTKAASMLLACRLHVEDLDIGLLPGSNTMVHNFAVTISGPRSACTVLNSEEPRTEYPWELDGRPVYFEGSADWPIAEAIFDAIRAVLPSRDWRVYVQNFNIRVQLIEIDPEWRTELLEIARGREINNQGTPIRGATIYQWMNLRFRSVSEMTIAEALDRTGVMFLPNCKARLNAGGKRKNREADFLVCLDGKWGILEVDGEPWHPETRTVEDHERDRIFMGHGIRVVQHFDGERCRLKADEVVREFLDLLRRSG